jgi:hypothetical protein
MIHMFSKTFISIILVIILLPNGQPQQIICKDESYNAYVISYNTTRYIPTDQKIGQNVLIEGDGINHRLMDDGLDQFSLYHTNIGLGILRQNWIAQSFIPTHKNLSAVKVYVGKLNESAPHKPLILKIRESLSGPDLLSLSKPPSEIPSFFSGDFIKFEFPPLQLTPGKTYYIILATDGCPNGYGWLFFENYSPYDLYEGGHGSSSQDAGGSWWDYEWVDLGFKTYFCPPAEQVDQYFTDISYICQSVGVFIKRDIAQEFIPRFQCLSKIDLKLDVEDEPLGPITMKIRNNLTGENLTGCSVQPFNLPHNGNRIGTIVSFDFPDISVIPHTSYYIILSSKHWGAWWWATEGYSGSFYPGRAYECWENTSWEEWDGDFWFKTYGYNGTPPEQPIPPIGPTTGNINTYYEYSTSTMDLDDDQIKYCYDWGDGSYSWTCYDSPETKHTWTKKDVYSLRVKAKDASGAESTWSDPLEVNMPKSKQIFLFLEERYPHFFNFLSSIL